MVDIATSFPSVNSYINLRFSPDGVYLVMINNERPFLEIYKRSGDSFTKLNNLSHMPSYSNNPYNADFSPDGVYLAIANEGSPRLIIYKRSGDSFTKLPNPTVPPLRVNGLAFSLDGNYLVAATQESPYISMI